MKQFLFILLLAFSITSHASYRVPDGSITAAKLNDQVFSSLTSVTIANDDYVSIADTSDSNKKKKALVGDIKSTTMRSVTTTDTASCTADQHLTLSGNSFSETIPAATGCTGKTITLLHNDTSLSKVYTLVTSEDIVTPNGNIASTNYKLTTKGESLTIRSNGTNWLQINHYTSTPWVDFPSLSAGTLITGTTTNPTYGTIQTHYARWRRNGANADIMWFYRATTAGGAGSGVYLFNLPSGLVMDTTYITVNTVIIFGATFADSVVGTFELGYSTAHGIGEVVPYSTTQLKAQLSNTTAAGAAGSQMWSSGDISFAINANMHFSIRATIPITGWQP